MNSLGEVTTVLVKLLRRSTSPASAKKEDDGRSRLFRDCALRLIDPQSEFRFSYRLVDFRARAFKLRRIVLLRLTPARIQSKTESENQG